MKSQRFQVNKMVEHAMKKQHPWIYRKQCSSAIDTLPKNALVRLVGTKNNFLGIGIHEPLSAIAIRVVSFEDLTISEEYFSKKLHKARLKRLKDIDDTNAYRWIHGEADGFPGLTIDIFDKVAAVTSYLSFWRDNLADVIASACRELGLTHCLWQAGGKNRVDMTTDLLTGKPAILEEPVCFHESDQIFHAYPLTGQKSGFYLDLREVRHFLRDIIQPEDRVLNLFSSGGSFTAIALSAGAKKCVSVEISEKEMEHAKALLTAWKIPAKNSEWHTEDVWEFMKMHQPKMPYSVIIIDPPSLASSERHLPQAKKAWVALHAAAIKLLAEDGVLISISCTERIDPEKQIAWTKEAAQLAGRNLSKAQLLPPPTDHPVLKSLPERDYFHAYVWRC